MQRREVLIARLTNKSTRSCIPYILYEVSRGSLHFGKSMWHNFMLFCRFFHWIGPKLPWAYSRTDLGPIWVSTYAHPVFKRSICKFRNIYIVNSNNVLTHRLCFALNAMHACISHCHWKKDMCILTKRGFSCPSLVLESLLAQHIWWWLSFIFYGTIHQIGICCAFCHGPLFN